MIMKIKFNDDISSDRYIPWWPRTNSNAFPIEVYAKLIWRWRVCCSICGRNRLVKVGIGLYCVLNNLTAIYEKFYLKWCEIWNIQRPGLEALQCKIFICIDYLFSDAHFDLWQKSSVNACVGIYGKESVCGLLPIVEGGNSNQGFCGCNCSSIPYLQLQIHEPVVDVRAWMINYIPPFSI